MKFFIALFVVFSMTTAHASYFATHCSNSKGDVKWQLGHNANQMTIRYAEDEIQIPILHVGIQFISEVSIRQESVRRCGFASSTKVVAGQVVITPSPDHPESLDFLGGTKKIETDVICTTHINTRTPCPEQE